MPTAPSDSTMWSLVSSLAKLSVLIGLAVAIYAIRSRRLIWFTVRAFNRRPPSRVHERGRRVRLAQLTSLLAALWYLKDLLVPRGLGHWLFGDVAPGIPSDHEPLASQEEPARRAAYLLLRRPIRIVIFTGKAGWGKTHTSHNLKTRLAPLAQVDVSWTMIAANPESRIVEEFIKTSKTTAGRSVSLSFEHLALLARGNRSQTSPHFFAHVHDFEAIAVESHSLASARGLIERVIRSPHISLVITTRHTQARLEKLLPILSSRLVAFIPVKERLLVADVRRLLTPGRPISNDVLLLSPLQLTLRRHYEERTRREGPGEGPTSAVAPAASDTREIYLRLFAYLKPAQQVCLQLFLARLVVSPERLFVRHPEELLAPLRDGDTLLRLFAYVEGGGEGDPVARLAHPTVLELYSDARIMSPATRQRRHQQWAEALAAGNTDSALDRLQLVRHELRAQRGRADHEEQITSVTLGGTLAICRFLFESRSDFHEYLLTTTEGDHASPGTILMLHDSTERADEYEKVVDALVSRSQSTVTSKVRTKNLVKMMELLYQGLDAWAAAKKLGDHLETLGANGSIYSWAMKAVFEFDSDANTRAAIESSREARRKWGQGPGNPPDQSPFTRATMLINEGIFCNNQFRNTCAADAAAFDNAGHLYDEAGKLIKAEMERETRREYRLLMLRELLRVASGQLRWTYLKDGASVDVGKAWRDARQLVEREAGWPLATPLQEFAYFALNASFIELARKGRRGLWREYYGHARNHQEAAGDTWFRLRLDQMAVLAATLDRGVRERREGLKALETVVGEMLGIDDWTGIAFCSYQIAVMGADRIDKDRIEARYAQYVTGGADRSFEKRLDREKLFSILCGDNVEDKGKYFPGWSESPMPLNLHGLLMLRAVSLLDQVNWTPVPEYEVRSIGTAHAGLLERFYETLYLPEFPHPDERESLENMLAYLRKREEGWYGKNDYQILLALEGETPIAGVIGDYLEAPDTAVVEFLVVSSERRGRGLGRKLLVAFEEAMKASARRARRNLFAVVAEMNDPYRWTPHADNLDPFTRAAIWHSWSFGRVDFPYVQAALSAGHADREAV